MKRQRLHFKDIGNYIVYPDGKVFSKKRGIFLVPLMGKGRSLYYTVKVPKIIKLHRLVAQCFIQNPENKPEVNHKDGNKTNNNYWNLEWTTKLENMQHSHKMGLHNNKGERSRTAKLDCVSVRIVRDCLQHGFTQTAIAKYFKVDPSTISAIKTGTSWASL